MQTIFLNCISCAARYQLVYGPAPVRGPPVGDHCCRAYERGVVKCAKLAIMPSSRVFGGFSNEDCPLHELSTVYNKQFKEIAV